MESSSIKQQIIEAIRANHPDKIEQGSEVTTSYEDLYKMLPDLDQEKIVAALAEMNSVKIIDELPNSLQFFPTLF